jgi:hypothetical protein
MRSASLSVVEVVVEVVAPLGRIADGTVGREVDVEAGVHRDGDAHVAAELLGQDHRDDLAQPLLDHVLGELVGDGEQRRLADHPVEGAEPHERSLLRGDGVLEDGQRPLPDLLEVNVRGRWGQLVRHACLPLATVLVALRGQ